MLDNARPTQGFDVSGYLEDIRSEAPARRPIDFVRLGNPTGYWCAHETQGTGASAFRSGKCWANVANGSLTYRLPRGIPWTEFPLVAPARMRCASSVWREDMVEVVDEAGGNVNRKIHRMPRIDALAQARGIVVDASVEPPFEPREHHAAFERQIRIARGVVVADSLAPGVRAFALDSGGRDTVWTPRAEVAGDARSAVSLFRHSYTYQVNARAILARALAHGLSGLDDATLSRTRSSLMGIRKGTGFTGDGCAAQCRRHVSEGRLHGLDEIIALQSLHRIRRMGRVPHDGLGDGHADMDREYRPVWALKGLFGQHQVGAFAWTGSGKHPARWYPRYRLHDYATGLAWLGLIQTDGTAVTLTDAGNRFLDVVHPDSEDSDVLCRWILPVVENRDIELAVDAWNMRVFRKCKTRANALP